METLQTQKTLFGTLLFAMLISSFSSTIIQASEGPNRAQQIMLDNTGKQIFTQHNAMIAVPFVAVLYVCSENIQNLTSKVYRTTYYKSKIALLSIAHNLPLISQGLKQRIADKIKETQDQYSKRSPIAGEKLKTYLKEFAEMIGIFSAIKTGYSWLN